MGVRRILGGVRRWVVLFVFGVVTLLFAGGVVLVPFTVSGSSQHSSALSSYISRCPQDDGDGPSAPGAKQRCVDEARLRLGVGAALGGLAAVELLAAAVVSGRAVLRASSGRRFVAAPGRS
jgi:hypothetical protein